jgi:hypothetical protein
MGRLGITAKDIDVPITQLVESTRALARVESAQIMSRKLLTREKVKKRLVEGHHTYLEKVRDMPGRLSHVW